MKNFLFTAILLLAATANGSEMFPFVISFDAPDNITNISSQLDAPAGKHGFVRVKDGHFATDEGRIQFWGTNTCFAANFLDKEKADRMADRLARFGINCVRLHHMDMRDIWGRGNIRTQMEFDKDQLDRLDYYVAALKKRGIYVNVNLHVSRSLDERDGFPPNVNRPSHDKGIDNYYRPFIEANKKYARDLLTHVNPYTGNAYKDEPSVAMIEINNENSIVCMWGGWGGLDAIQDPFLADLRKDWNTWLKAKYKTDGELKKAWKSRSVPLGNEMLKNVLAWNNGTTWDGWNWETDAQSDAPITNENGVLKLDVRKKGTVDWHPQLVGSGFEVKKGQIYTVEIKIKANKSTNANIGVRMNHEPWEGLGFDTQMKLSTEPQTFRYTISPTENDSNARITIGSLQAGAVYEISSISIKPGGNVGLAEGESLQTETVPVIWRKDTGNHPKEAVDDFCDFLLDIEAKYWDEMYVFLKDEIGVKQPVSGTQLEYGSTHAQAKMDYCDIHSYWNHPTFPGRAWDGNNWYLHNRALVNNLDKQILPQLATKRVEGKPFTVSEYNHPYPNQYAAEGIPLLAAFGAFQDWDGIFPFAYSHSNDPEPRMATSFFDTAGNSVQMAHMIACRNLFNLPAEKGRIDVTEIVAPLTAEKEREIFKRERGPYGFGFAGLGLDIRNALTHRTAVDVSGTVKDTPKPAAIPKDQKTFITNDSQDEAFLWIRYNMEKPNHGYVLASGGAALFTGFVEKNKEYDLMPRMAKISFDETRLGWATVSITTIDSKRALMTLTGEMLNTDMKIESLGDDRITIGNRWGKPPVLCEGIPATFTITIPPGIDVDPNPECWALDESGNRKQQVPVKKDGKNYVFEFKPEYKTIWYELVNKD